VDEGGRRGRKGKRADEGSKTGEEEEAEARWTEQWVRQLGLYQ